MSEENGIVLQVGGYAVYLYGDLGAAEPMPLVVTHSVMPGGEALWRKLKEHVAAPCVLVEVIVPDPESALTPWYAVSPDSRRRVYKGFGPAYLSVLLHDILPAVEAKLATPPLYRALVGYSLAGLFALWSILETDGFTRIGLADASLWYPDLIGRIRTSTVADCLRKICIVATQIYPDRDDPRQPPEHRLNTAEPYLGRLVVALRVRGQQIRLEKLCGRQYEDPAETLAACITALLGME